MRPMTTWKIISVASVLALATCTDVASPGTARLQIALTDAPSDYISSATVTIAALRLLPANDTGAAIVLGEGLGTFELLDLQDGVTADLAALDIPTGTYRELRIVVDSAAVTLADGYTFAAGGTTATLRTPSASASGIKVKLAGADGDGASGDGLVIDGDMLLVVDFDVAQNFRLQGNPNTPAGIKGVSFTPVLRATVAATAGVIEGTVTNVANVPLSGVRVRAHWLGESEMADATGVTDVDGHYRVGMLAPGPWSVSVDDIDAPARDAEVTAGDVTTIDFHAQS